MKIHREGRNILTRTVLICITAGLLYSFFTDAEISSLLLIWIMLAGIIFWVAMFFRVPRRNAVADDSVILSGADGKVVAIETITEPEYFGDKRIQVSVFMSLINVHVNYIPISGLVTFNKYHHGRHYFAWVPKSSSENERNILVIRNPLLGEIMVRQIAGAFARRIVTHYKTGDNVVQGQELGIIKFGSRVDIILPPSLKVKVKLGQKVRGGKTVIASSY